jgi:hypothetical protein
MSESGSVTNESIQFEGPEFEKAVLKVIEKHHVLVGHLLRQRCIENPFLASIPESLQRHGEPSRSLTPNQNPQSQEPLLDQPA